MTNTNPNPLPAGGGPDRRRWLAGHKRLELLQDLAAGDLSFAQLSVKYDRYKTNIFNFAKNHEAEVQAIRDQHGDALAGLWIADKANRVAELQASVDRLVEAQESAARADPALERAVQSALRAVAEELGQLTSKVEGRHIVYQVTGVDPDDLT
jgi:hypothetical protein